MKHEIISLSEKPTEHGFVPTLKTYLLDTIAEKDCLRPAIIICPGGGYSGCSYREGERIATAYNAAGFHAFVLNYSVAPHKHPTQITDAANAIRYVRLHSEDFGINPDNIVIIGFSAGGHLATSISTLWNNDTIFSEEEINSQLHKPNACILGYPVITSGDKAHKRSFTNLLGEDANSEMLDFMSLENRVSQATPPTFIWHSYEDAVVPVENSLLYASSLARFRIPCEMHIYPIGPHGLSRASDETLWAIPRFRRKYDWLEKSVEWLIDLFDLKYFVR